jgi:hypothetical protein
MEVTMKVLAWLMVLTVLGWMAWCLVIVPIWGVIDKLTGKYKDEEMGGGVLREAPGVTQEWLDEHLKAKKEEVSDGKPNSVDLPHS